MLVLAGGPGLPDLRALPPHVALIAADGGTAHARRLGLRPDLVVGDLDSLPAGELETLARDGVRVERHPVDKDQTDLELALAAALALEPERIVVVGSAEGRFDHTIGQLLILGSSNLAGVEVDAYLGEASLHVVRGRRTLDGSPGELVSLFALHGDAHGVTTRGLRYALNGATLLAGVGLGVSNVVEDEQVQIAVEDGVLMVVRPGTAAADTASS